MYWMNCHLDPVTESFREEYPARKLSLTVLQRLLDGSVLSKVTLHSAVRVEDSTMWVAYDQKKIELAEKWGLATGQRCTPVHHIGEAGEQVLTTAILHDSEREAAISLENLSMRMNELFLFHGTSKEAAYGITKTGFHINQDPGGTRFGNGAYFADEVSKSLFYATESDGKRYILFCRVACGQFYYTEQASDQSATAKAKSEGKDSTLANPGGMGPREFVVFQESQVYPEYILEVSAPDCLNV